MDEADQFYEMMLGHAQAYRDTWPNRCSKCLGWGFQTNAEGGTSPCDCVAEGRCPRCAATMAAEPCLFCHWDRHQPGESMP